MSEETGRTATLSLSNAWVDTRQLLERDGRLYGAVALALIILPTVILGVIDPRESVQSDSPMWFSLLMFIGTFISLAGQLALIRLSLGPSVTVGGAIGHGIGRLPRYVLSLILLGLVAVLATIPFALVATALGMRIDEGAQTPLTGPLATLILVYVLAMIFLFTRMLLAMPVAAAERAGPVDILKRSWALSSGHWLKLFGFLIVALIGAMLVLLAVATVAGSIIVLFIGQPEPMSVGALIEALISGIMTGVFSVLFTLILSRIYVQLSGRTTAEPTA